MARYRATRFLASLDGDGRKWFAPDTIDIGPKEVVVRRWVRSDIRQREEVLVPARIAQVRVKRGILVHALVLETTGGGLVAIPGMRRRDAEAAAREIRALLA